MLGKLLEALKNIYNILFTYPYFRKAFVHVLKPDVLCNRLVNVNSKQSEINKASAKVAIIRKNAK